MENAMFLKQSRLLAPLAASVALYGETGNKLLTKCLLGILFVASIYLSYRGFV